MKKYYIIILFILNQSFCYSQIIDSQKQGLIENQSYFSLMHIATYLLAFLFGIVPTLFYYKKRLNTLRKKNNELNKKIEKLKWNPISKQVSSSSISTIISSQDNKKEVEQEETIKEIISQPIELEVENRLPLVTNTRILYFPNPNLDGHFKHNEGKETFIEGTSVYKFTLLDEYNATIEFCDNVSSVKIALNNKDIMILGLAIETNLHTPNVHQILIVDNQKAKAQLENNIWVIKEKAKIKYV